MAWTTPVTVVTGNTITAAWGNTYVRDNTRYLKGMDGAIVFESGAQFDTNVLVIDATNNRVGVNRSSPAQSLHVVGTALLATDTNADTGGLSVAQVDGEIAIDTYARTKQINFHADALVIGTGEDGNVGIGRSTPAQKLHVAGGALLATDADADSGGISIVQSGGAIAIDTDARTKQINFHANGLVIGTGADAKVGVGKAPSTYALEVDGTIDATALRGDGSALTALSASQLSSGTIPDGRFPATLPAVSGANLTNLDASDLATGTVAKARLPTAFDFRTLSVADNATSQLGTIAKPTALAIIFSDGPAFNRPVLYWLYGSANAVAEISDPDTGYTSVAGNAGTNNIYYSVGNARYEIENKTGAARTYYVLILSPVD